MRLLCLASITVVIVAFVTIATPINAREICKNTTLYPLTFPPGKAEHMILCHPVGMALTAANNANLRFNAGVVAGQKTPADMECPSSNKDFCQGWDSVKIKTLNDVGRCVGSSHVNYCRLVLAFYSLTPILLFYGG